MSRTEFGLCQCDENVTEMNNKNNKNNKEQ